MPSQAQSAHRRDLKKDENISIPHYLKRLRASAIAVFAVPPFIFDTPKLKQMRCHSLKRTLAPVMHDGAGDNPKADKYGQH
jgi:hypothetical protein